ncbi:hypothetical protein NIES2100_48890 [Calothrix sp. NIES-2100]|nr:hypothetical protein NIES2100_48890 [Calothrix sp. NIES-2100]
MFYSHLLFNQQFFTISITYAGKYLIHFKQFVADKYAVGCLIFLSGHSKIINIKPDCETAIVYANYNFHRHFHDHPLVFDV